MTLSPAQPYFELAELTEALNALPRPMRGRESWTRWSARRMLEAFGVCFKRRGERGKFYTTASELRGAGVFDELLQADAIAATQSAA